MLAPSAQLLAELPLLGSASKTRLLSLSVLFERHRLRGNPCYRRQLEPAPQICAKCLGFRYLGFIGENLWGANDGQEEEKPQRPLRSQVCLGLAVDERSDEDGKAIAMYTTFRRR